MSEIKKLRTRLSNVNKNVTQYSMTIVEARALISEIDSLISKQLPVTTAEAAPLVVIHTIMDGGTLA